MPGTGARAIGKPAGGPRPACRAGRGAGGVRIARQTRSKCALDGALDRHIWYKWLPRGTGTWPLGPDMLRAERRFRTTQS